MQLNFVLLKDFSEKTVLDCHSLFCLELTFTVKKIDSYGQLEAECMKIHALEGGSSAQPAPLSQSGTPQTVNV